MLYPAELREHLVAKVPKKGLFFNGFFGFALFMRELYNKGMKKLLSVIIILFSAAAIYVASAGYGPSQDRLADIRAVESLRIPALLGDNAAKLEIARFYFTGAHVKADDEKGAKWIKCAADKGDSNAIGLMGFLHMGGIGVEQDFARAREWLTQSDSPQAIELALKLQTLDRAIAILPADQKAKLEKATYDAAAKDMRPLLLKTLERKAQ